MNRNNEFMLPAYFESSMSVNGMEKGRIFSR